MDFLEEWQSQLHRSFTELAQLSSQAGEIDLSYGLIPTAILWPVRQDLFAPPGFATLNQLCGINAGHVFGILGGWRDLEILAAARTMGRAGPNQPRLATGLRGTE